MPHSSTVAYIGGLIKSKRSKEGIGLRKAAADSGTSASTLSRLERGIATRLPATDTLRNLSQWLSVSLEALIDEPKQNKKSSAPKLETTDQVEVFLRADKNLSPESAKALSTAFKVLYDQFASAPSATKTTSRGRKNSGT